MKDTDRAELLRVLELDYEKTTKTVEGIISSSFTIRGWGITLISALVGLTFQAQLWQIAALAAVVSLLVAFIDGYHSWLYARTLQHAGDIERVLRLYYAALARGEHDPDVRRDFEVALLAHRFGRFAETHQFNLKALRDSRPRIVILALYGTLLICAVVSGALVFHSKKAPAAKFECTAVSGAANVYMCQPK
jgi:hypothetical protein